MRLLLLFILTFLLNHSGYSQFGECGTTPSQAQLQYMNNHAVSALQYSVSHKQVTYIPVLPHIIRKSDGTGGITPIDILNEIDSVNFFYANAGIEFIVCGNIEYIDNDMYFHLDVTEEINLGLQHDVPNVINIYFANNLSYGSSSLCGKSNFPPGADRVLMNNTCATNGSTLAHELGHYFSLYHTHGNGGYPELADGSNCSLAGDEICDTPADPGLTYYIDAQCNYTGPANDFLGNPYNPQTNNIMSYSRKECRSLFTAQQYQRIAYSFSNDRSYLNCAVSGINQNIRETFTIKQYPNPFNTELTVECELMKESLVNLELTDMLGKKALSFSQNNVNAGVYKHSFNTSSLAAGVYLLTINIDGQITNHKIVCRP